MSLRFLEKEERDLEVEGSEAVFLAQTQWGQAASDFLC